MKKIFILLFSLFLLSNVYGQKSEKEILDTFFQTYNTDPIKAIEYIYGTNKWIDIAGDDVKQLKGQMKQFIELVGKYYGEEYVSSAKLGDSFITYIYLAKYDRQAIRFTFEFYKPNDKWKLYLFKFDDSFNKDLEEVMKYEYLNRNY